MMRVLYTGFKGKNNSSYQLLSRLSGEKLFLTNSFEGLKKDIMSIKDSYDLVIMFGLDTKIKDIVRIEAVAKFEDVERKTEIDCDEICRCMMARGIQSVASKIPTQYLCNAAYFHMLQKLEGKAVFIHIPTSKNMSDDMMDKIVKWLEEMKNV